MKEEDDEVTQDVPTGTRIGISAGRSQTFPNTWNGISAATTTGGSHDPPAKASAITAAEDTSAILYLQRSENNTDI